MTLVSTGDLMDRTRTERAVLAFNVVTLEHIEGVLEGAHRARRPVVIAVSENAVAFHRGQLLPLTAAAVAAANDTDVEVGLHLDHVEDAALLEPAARAGYSSVMFDAGRLPYDDNVAATCAAASWGHEHGLWIEAELGFVGGKATQAQSAHDPGVRTDPEQAAAFVTSTGVDALAVAVGSSHAMTTRTAVLDDDLIARLRTAVPVPLVLHGSSGVPDEGLRSAVASGMRKINVGTALGMAYTGAVRDTLAADPTIVDPRVYLAPARDAIATLVAHLLTELT